MSNETQPFVWKGKTLSTVRDLMDAMFAIDHVEEAAYFMHEYRKVNEHADSNVGYLLGYVEPRERRQQMYNLFMVQHPVFGGAP